MHEAMWNAANVAVKKLVDAEYGTLQLEEFAIFYAEVFRIVCLASDCVVRVHGMTNSG